MRKAVLLSTVTWLTVTSIAAAHAAVPLFSENTTEQYFSNGAAISVALNAAGATTLSFTTTARKQRVVIMFNAECAIDGGSANSAQVDIIVSAPGFGPLTVTPSDGDNAFCSGNGTTNLGHDGWVSAVTVGSVIVPNPGTNSVSVKVVPSFSGSVPTIRLDDISLTILD